MMDLQNLFSPALDFILQTEDFLMHRIATGPGDSYSIADDSKKDAVVKNQKFKGNTCSPGQKKNVGCKCVVKPQENANGVPSKTKPPILSTLKSSRSPSPNRTSQQSTPSLVQAVCYHKGSADMCRYRADNQFLPRVPLKAETKSKMLLPPQEKEVPKAKCSKTSVKVAYLRTGLPLCIPPSDSLLDHSADDGNYWWSDPTDKTIDVSSKPLSLYGQNVPIDIDCEASTAPSPTAVQENGGEQNLEEPLIDSSLFRCQPWPIRGGVADSSSGNSTPNVLRKSNENLNVDKDKCGQKKNGKKSKAKFKGTRRKSRKDGAKKSLSVEQSDNVIDNLDKYNGDNERSSSATPVLNKKQVSGKLQKGEDTCERKYHIRTLVSGIHQSKVSTPDGSASSGINQRGKTDASNVLKSLAHGSLRSLAVVSFGQKNGPHGTYVIPNSDKPGVRLKGGGPPKLLSRNTTNNLLETTSLASKVNTPQSAPVSPQRNKATQSSFSAICAKCGSLPNVSVASIQKCGQHLIQSNKHITSGSLPNVTVVPGQDSQIQNGQFALLARENKISSSNSTQGSHPNQSWQNSSSQITSVMPRSCVLSDLDRVVTPSLDIQASPGRHDTLAVTPPFPLSRNTPGNDGSLSSDKMSSLAGKGGRKEQTSNCCVETSNVLTVLEKDGRMAVEDWILRKLHSTTTTTTTTITSGDISESDSPVFRRKINSDPPTLQQVNDPKSSTLSVKNDTRIVKRYAAANAIGTKSPQLNRVAKTPSIISSEFAAINREINPKKQLREPTDDSSTLKTSVKINQSYLTSESHKKDIGSKRKYILQQILQSARQGESKGKETHSGRREIEPLRHSHHKASNIAAHIKEHGTSKYVAQDYKKGMRHAESFGSVKMADNSNELGKENIKKKMRLSRKASFAILSRVDSISLGTLSSELATNVLKEEDSADNEKKTGRTRDNDDNDMKIRDHSSETNSAPEKSDSHQKKKHDRLAATIMQVIKTARSHEHKVRELTAPKGGSYSDDSFTFCFSERLGGSFEKWMKSSTSKVAVRKKMDLLRDAELMDYSGRYDDLSNDGFSNDSSSPMFSEHRVPVEKEIKSLMGQTVNTATDNKIAFSALPALSKTGLPVLDDGISPGRSLTEHSDIVSERLTSACQEADGVQNSLQRNSLNNCGLSPNNEMEKAAFNSSHLEDVSLDHITKDINPKETESFEFKNHYKHDKQIHANQTVAIEMTSDDDSKNIQQDQYRHKVFLRINNKETKCDREIFNNQASPQRQPDKVLYNIEASPVKTRCKPNAASICHVGKTEPIHNTANTISVNFVTRSPKQPLVLKDKPVIPAMNTKDIRALVPCRKEMQTVGLTSKELQVAFANKNNIKQSFANHIKQSFPPNSRVLAKINQLPLKCMLENLYLEPQVSKLNHCSKESDAECLLATMDQTIRLTPHFPYIIGLPVHSEVLQLALKIEELSSKDLSNVRLNSLNDSVLPNCYLSSLEIVRQHEPDMPDDNSPHYHADRVNTNETKQDLHPESDTLCDSSEKSAKIEPQSSVDLQACKLCPSPHPDQQTRTNFVQVSEKETRSFALNSQAKPDEKSRLDQACQMELSHLIPQTQKTSGSMADALPRDSEPNGQSMRSFEGPQTPVMPLKDLKLLSCLY
jgi:hypothetical protein